jgi:ferredoxin
MIKSEVKPLEEIKEMLTGYHKILNTGCGGCSSVCLAGGMKEVNNLNTKLTLSCQADNPNFQINGFTVERQCENNFLAELDSIIKPYDAVLSMACGAGVQYLAERFPEKPVFPAVNTKFVGINKDIGWYEERCKTCGDCILGLTGGICPVSMCAKSLFNGPCGGPQEGHCEVDNDIPCAWVNIYDRLKKQNRLDNIQKIHEPREWQDQVQGRIILEAYKDRYIQDSSE